MRYETRTAPLIQQIIPRHAHGLGDMQGQVDDDAFSARGIGVVRDRTGNGSDVALRRGQVPVIGSGTGGVDT